MVIVIEIEISRLCDITCNNNSYVPSFQQHLNIMRSTYKLLISDFVELKVTFEGHTESLRTKTARSKHHGLPEGFMLVPRA